MTLLPLRYTRSAVQVDGSLPGTLGSYPQGSCLKESSYTSRQGLFIRLYTTRHTEVLSVRKSPHFVSHYTYLVSDTSGHTNRHKKRAEYK